MLTTDPRLTAEHERAGPWTELYPMKVLTPWAFAEAIMLLWCRDDAQVEGLGQAWEEMLSMIMKSDSEVKTHINPQFAACWESHMLRKPLLKIGGIRCDRFAPR